MNKEDTQKRRFRRFFKPIVFVLGIGGVSAGVITSFLSNRVEDSYQAFTAEPCETLKSRDYSCDWLGLSKAIGRGDEEAIEIFNELDKDCQLVSASDNKLLLKAVRANNENMASMWKQKCKIDVNQRMTREVFDLTESMLSDYIDFDLIDELITGESPTLMEYSIMSNNVEAITWLHSQGVKLPAKSLDLAIAAFAPETVSTLIELGEQQPPHASSIRHLRAFAEIPGDKKHSRALSAIESRFAE